MTTIDNDVARAALLDALLEKVRDDRYPSNTMLNQIESLLTPAETPAYVVMLQERIREDTYPSIPLIKRLVRLIES